MFNRQPFNREGFNRSSGQSSGASGIALLKLTAASVEARRTIAASGTSSMKMQQTSVATVIKYAAALAALVLKGTGKGTKYFIAQADPGNMALKTAASQTLTGEASINLTGITLKPGDELIINTCDMSITLNGESVMEYMDANSEFFNLLSGLNTLEYTDGSEERTASFDVIWKDRWL
ncbi:phage distal tail protein [Aminipila luticellarii]|uniref:Siphovirus-type tail component C-terminal domain-containing protein n=1 Tax=Aminipila luticellarii TaxID=2507160 RepID=A0A410PX03_9FIRM|nr:phage tail domain-containing protein [Aminipila luticellarii]QAT43435.1 hypothetical protein EQM06_09530 [Aminipila luticellarii]